MAATLQVFLLTFAIFGASGQRVPFNGTNPLLPQGTSFSYNVVLDFRTTAEKIGPVCNRYITVPGSEKKVDVRTRQPLSAHEVRVPPQVTIQGPAGTQLFTLILAAQPEEENEFATPTRPFIHYIQSDIQIGRSGALTLSYFVPFLPVTSEGEIVLVMLYSQTGPMSVDTSVFRFVDNECSVGAGRCSFRLEDFVANNSLTLESAGYFLVATDQYSTAAASALPFFENGCFWLDKFDLRANVLVGEKADELTLGVMAKFVTPGEMLDPVCGRVFHYKEDKVEITARTGKPIPARKTRKIPWVWYHTIDGDESWKEDWFTLAYVSQVTDMPAVGSPEKPLLLWLVTNIHGGDVSNGMCDVPYLPAMPTEGEQEQVFLLFKQKKKVEINAADYSESDCDLQFRCSFNVSKMAKENDLMLVGAQNFKLAADPHTIISAMKAGHKTEAEACTLLRNFKEEGKMLGQCLPKFTTWKDMWEKLQKAEDEEEKKKMMEKMKDMCPELDKDFSQDKPYGMEEMKEKMEEKMSEMKEWMKDKMEKKEEQVKWEKEMQMKKDFMMMLMKKMLGEKMYDMSDKKDGADKEDKKDCASEMMEMMMKMKSGMDLMSGSWEEKEKQFGPCMMVVSMQLKKMHQEYVARKKMEYMKDKFEQYMKEKMYEFVKHMMLKKMADYLGMEKCGGEDGEEDPCADPEKVRMMLWKKYVMMKGMKQGYGEDEKDGEGNDVKKMYMMKEKMMQEKKKQMKEIFFMKSVMSMMKEKKESKTENKEGDTLPALKEFVMKDPGWKRFCDDL